MITDRNLLKAGTKLVANYKGKEHHAEVIETKDGLRFVVSGDKTEYKTISGAAKSLHSGRSGYAFWSLAEHTAKSAVPATLTGKQIQALARDIVVSNPGGIRFRDIVRQIKDNSPETKIPLIQNSVANLAAAFPSEITKLSRGLYQPADAAEDTGAEAVSESTTEVTSQGTTVTESDFYIPFAEWLKGEEEVTNVAPLGGSGLGGKWGTPDVVGTYRPGSSAVFKYYLEIVSAEIKIQKIAAVVAFGQAVAYRLFSAKSYIAMPNTLTKVDEDKLDALCMLFGVGLVLFDLDPTNPNFTIRVRAQRFSPDMSFANEFAESLRQHDKVKFKLLFD